MHERCWCGVLGASALGNLWCPAPVCTRACCLWLGASTLPSRFFQGSLLLCVRRASHAAQHILAECGSRSAELLVHLAQRDSRADGLDLSGICHTPVSLRFMTFN